MTNSTELDKSVRIVMLQFSFSDLDAIPSTVKSLARSPVVYDASQKKKRTGTVIFSDIENCLLSSFMLELEKNNYEITSAFCQKRTSVKKPLPDIVNHIVRFCFARHEHVNISENFRQIRPALRTELQWICDSALWKLDLYRNPFYWEKGEDRNFFTISVDLKNRQPLNELHCRSVTTQASEIQNQPPKPNDRYVLQIESNHLALISA